MDRARGDTMHERLGCARRVAAIGQTPRPRQGVLAARYLSAMLAAAFAGCARDDDGAVGLHDAPSSPARVVAASSTADHPTTDALVLPDGEGLGAAVYERACAGCHEAGSDVRTPTLAGLRTMSSGQISFALTAGKMKAQAEDLAREDIAALVAFISGDDGATASMQEWPTCSDDPITVKDAPVSRWGLDAANSRHATRTATSIDRENVADLEVAWAFGLPGVSETRAQPVITKDTVFLATMAGDVFALGRETGCLKWRQTFDEPIRAPLSLGRIDAAPVILGATARADAFAIDAVTGDIRWRAAAGLFPESMSTSGIVQHNDVIIVPLSSMDVAAAMNPAHECCKSHGAVAAHDVRTGERLWAAHMTEPARQTGVSAVGTQLWGPSGAPVWTTPAIDADAGRVYVGTGENTSAPATDTSDAIIAINLADGTRVWTYQATAEDTFNMACHPLRPDGPNCPETEGPDYDFGGAVVFATLGDGRKAVIGGQKSGDVHAVDAADGSLIWRTKVSAGSPLGGVHWGISVADGRVYAPASDPPYPLPGYAPRPGLTALDLDSGEILWRAEAERGCKKTFLEHQSNQEAWPDCSFFFGYSAAPTSTDDLVFVGALDGRIIAYDALDGGEVWSFETKRPFDTANGVKAHGGAIDNAGVQLADDMLFVQSGYSLFGQMPGNVLVAFRLGASNDAE
ncbi:MAG: PQQ-binding-like beta-propeller repeat protein [Alphaproteobacteria bacterium]|nr:PQQ-binding-like beta-propeller repeat protein [Alphaproteobacteria bacterium]